MSEIVKENEVLLPVVLASVEGVSHEVLKEKYGRIYRVVTSIAPEDDDEQVDVKLYFVKPMKPSFNRYIKNASKDSLSAMNDFVLDNVVEEQREGMQVLIEEYPALALNVGEKLLTMLGLAKSANFKRL